MQGMDARPQSFEVMDENNTPIPVPLPTEVPPPPDLSALPPSIVHSGTVETLIGLNEDLMARLKVNIRRNGILEQQILENEKVHGELARTNQSLMTQLQVLHEKERLTREKSSKLDSMKSEIELLRSRLAPETAFRRRVVRWVRPFIDRVKKDLGAEKLRAQILEERLASREAQLSDVKARLTEAVSHMQNQEKIYSKDQAKLVEQYESKRRDLEKEIEKLRSETRSLREKAARVDEAVSQKTDAQNRIVYLERRNEELERRFQTELVEFQEQAAKYRQEAKMLAVETLDLDRRFRETNEKLEAQTEAHSRLQDQFESLQTLWADAQKKLEASRLQQESLNRLNQELSRQLKEQRKSAEGKPEAKTESAAPSAPKPTSAQSSNDRLEKIDSLLAELESGLIMARTPETARVRNLEIIENEDKKNTSSEGEAEAKA